MTGKSQENRMPGKGETPLDLSLRLIQKGLFESGQAVLAKHDIVLEGSVLTELIEDGLKRARTSRADGSIRTSIRYARRAAALTMLRDAGHITANIIPTVGLPEGYCGKIMLFVAAGVLIPERIFLRSGDDWHREILRNFEEEVRDYGFETFHITPQGGAFAEFQPDGAIVLYGSSEAFGRLEREDAIGLVQEAYPNRHVHWSDVAGI
jgi:hypothetical protein